MPRRTPPVPRCCRQRADPRAFLCALLMIVAGWVPVTTDSIAAEPVASEYQIKAAHLVNFAKYVDWPAEAFAEENSPIVIAVLGDSKVIEELRKVIMGRTVNGRTMTLKRLAGGEESGGCHILFFSASEQQRSSSLLAKLNGASILTVGENDDFLERGGVINLARRDQRIALEVNLTAAGNARIKISSKLLGVASIVKGKTK